ncbi:MAG: hypothetical protein A3H98_07375 [Bacteroidetes bacterium RIFCSPLOWO2_02_FULL_36_8]|nr:MAG: hypothetical protein A3H98_07375 [Bacteroidetes bacterium RIFCSPLOWO2_02_FULL_36_8]OFY69904.1 MAG: hypothetical protein A3G23_05435 [Bacteroidetes bacterium RIFCSPLOWO2_12_FULL_37_12]
MAYLVYQPASNGNFFMDDFDHFTNECLTFTDFFTGTCRRWYQPLAYSLVKLDILYDNNPPYFSHFTAIILHGFYSWMIFFILKKFMQVHAAILGAMFFLFHSVTVTPVSWVGEIHQSMVSVFVLLTGWFCYLYNHSSQQFLRYYLLCFLFFALSIFCKESGVNAFGIMLIVTFYFQFRRRETECRSNQHTKRWLLLIPFFLITVGYSYIRLFCMENIQFFGEQDYRMMFGLNVIENLGRYLLVICSPFSSVHLFQLGLAEDYIFLSLLLVIFTIPFIFGFLFFIKNNIRTGVFFILLFLASTLPYILLRKASEGYVYQPLGIFSIFMGFVVNELFNLNKRYKFATYLFMGIFIIISFISVRNKIELLLRNGKSAEKIISEVLTYKKEIDKADSLIMFDGEKEAVTYSIYLQEGFQLIFNAPDIKNILNVRLKRDNLMARVVPLHRVPEIKITENVVALIYERGRVRRVLQGIKN